MPDCWPPCSPWCTCDTTTGQCSARAVTINAIRLRTPDGRFLQSPAAGTLLVAAAVASPGAAETFLFASDMTGPRTSGDSIQLRGCDASFGASGLQVRVDHSVQVLPRTGGGKNAPPLVTYEIGGPGMAVFVSGPLPAGYPAYRADDPAEWTFDIVKAGGGPIADGDSVSLRINSNLGRTFFFRVTGSQPGAGVNGDGTSQGAPGTVFIVTFNEVLAGSGWRPAAVVCRSCADVVGSVINQTSKAAIPGAFVEALDVLENHPFTGTTGRNGRFALADAEGRTCIPSGAVRFRATTNRHQPKIHGPLTLPTSGFVDLTIELECTNVSGVVVDQADRPLAGLAIALVDIMSHAPILALDGQPFVTTTAMDGSFVFRCVPHGAVAAWLMSEPTRFHPVPVPPQGVNVKIITQTVCGNLIGTVRNAVSLAPIQLATVAVIGQTPVQTNANGEFRLTCVRPAGVHQLLASAVGFTLGAGFGTVPMSGDSVPVDIRLQPLAVASIAIRLDWAALPADLDLRFTGPDNMGGRFQVVWALPMPVSYVRLDQDVTMGFGPETVTLTPLIVGTYVPGIYRVWVLNVTALQGVGSTYDMSNAVVTVITTGSGGLNQIGRFEVADATGVQDTPVWHVCDLDVTANGVVTVIPVESLVPGGPGVIN